MSTDAPEPAAWTLGSQATADGVRLTFAVPAQGVEAAIALTREEARTFARGLLAAAGDATERTFPHPSIGHEHG